MNDNNVKQPRCQDDLPELCAMSDLEAILPVSRATAYRMAQKGELPCLRLGKRFIFSKEHLKRWIEQKMTGEVRNNGQAS